MLRIRDSLTSCTRMPARSMMVDHLEPMPPSHSHPSTTCKLALYHNLQAMLDASVLELLPLAVELGTCSAAAGSLAGQLVAQATAQCPPRDVITALLEAIAVHGRWGRQ